MPVIVQPKKDEPWSVDYAEGTLRGKDIEYVQIWPPEYINEKFDDLRLDITGNILHEDKVKIAEIITEALSKVVLDV